MSDKEKILAQFTGYYEKHKKAIFNYILYRIGFNRDTAEDLTSEVFLKAFEHFDSYDCSRPFKTWIFTIAHNHVVNFYAAKKEVLPLDETINIAENAPKVSEETEHKMAVAKIMHLVSLLPESQQELITMRYVNDLSNNEIAEILEKEEGAIRTALSRAIAALRNQYNLSLSQENP